MQMSIKEFYSWLNALYKLIELENKAITEQNEHF